MYKKFSRGFTLIELLVVIAIIGILASIVLVSLNSARNKGKDVRIISDIRQVGTQLETEASASGSYLVGSTLCVTAIGSNGAATINATQGNCLTLNSDATSNGGTLSVQTAAASGATSFSGYAVYGTLNAGGYFCADSTGSTTQKTTAVPAAASVATCR
jgi:prepilin-type N-terminal cleavage/methylation domain-containing protein